MPPTPGPKSPFDIGEILSTAWKLFAANPTAHIVAALIYFGLTLVTCGLAVLVMGVLMAGVTVMGLKGLRGEPIEISDAFAGFGEHFGQLFLMGIVLLAFVLVGTLLCILPGIYAMLVFSLATPLIIDRKLGFWDAMMTSARVFHDNLGPMLLATLVLYLINVVGSSIPLGFLIAQPLWILGTTVLYARIYGLTPQQAA